MLSLRVSRLTVLGSRSVYGCSRIGEREVVGHGMNGMYVYGDAAHHPFPAIRFKENSAEIQALREKEKGDWKKLTLEEKKALYRASFCQTFAEFQQHTGTWKFCVGCGLFVLGWAFWIFTFVKFYVCDPLPASCSEESQRAQLRRILDLHVNPIDGISSTFDYEKDEWKKTGFFGS